VRADGKHTAQRVLECAMRELDEHGAVNFNLDRVISSSQVSRSSIYHLFGSRAGLIAHAEAEAVRLDVTDGAHLLRNLAEQVESREQLVHLIELWLSDAMSAPRVKQRARRIANIAAAQSNPSLATAIHEHLHAISAVWVETYEILQRRSLVDVPQVDLHSLALAVQGQYLGGILVDLYDDPAVAAGWVRVVRDMLASFFGIAPERKTPDF
jgi:AcrR family transcriptional regulator